MERPVDPFGLGARLANASAPERVSNTSLDCGPVPQVGASAFAAAD